jgi:O-antigen/teichoic acid export membrane protein
VKKRLLELALVATPKFLTGFLNVALNAALLRYLGPAEYGVFALCTAGIILFDSIFGAAADNSMFKLVQAERHLGPGHTLAIERAALLVKGLLWMAAALALALAAREISRRWFHQEGRTALVAILLAAAGAVLVFRSLLAHWQIRERFAGYGAIDTVHSVFKFGGTALFVIVVGAPSTEPIIGIFALAPLLVVAGAALTGGFPLFHVHPSMPVVRRVARVSLWFVLTFGLSVVLSRLDLFVLAELSSIEAVGIYSGGQVFALIPELVGSLLSVVFVPRIYAYWQAGRLQRLGTIVAVGGIVAGIVATATAWLTRDWLAHLFPASFAPSLEIFLILLPGYMAGMIAFPLAIPFLMFSRPRAILMLDLVTLPLMLGLFAWLISQHGAVGAAWAATMTRFCKVGIMHGLAWRALRRTPRPPADALVVA